MEENRRDIFNMLGDSGPFGNDHKAVFEAADRLAEAASYYIDRLNRVGRRETVRDYTEAQEAFNYARAEYRRLRDTMNG